MAWVLTHPERGVFLGCWLGLSFWSKLDPAGQPAAPTFPSTEEAESFMAEWEGGRPQDVRLVEVVPDDGTYASVAACVAAGLEGWLVDSSPTANVLPV